MSRISDWYADREGSREPFDGWGNDDPTVTTSETWTERGQPVVPSSGDARPLVAGSKTAIGKVSRSRTTYGKVPSGAAAPSAVPPVTTALLSSPARQALTALFRQMPAISDKTAARRLRDAGHQVTRAQVSPELVRLRSVHPLLSTKAAKATGRSTRGRASSRRPPIMPPALVEVARLLPRTSTVYDLARRAKRLRLPVSEAQVRLVWGQELKRRREQQFAKEESESSARAAARAIDRARQERSAARPDLSRPLLPVPQSPPAPSARPSALAPKIDNGKHERKRAAALRKKQARTAELTSGRPGGTTCPGCGVRVDPLRAWCPCSD